MIPLRDDVPARKYPVATFLIIAVNVAVFLYQLSLPDPYLDRLVDEMGLVPARLTPAGERSSTPWLWTSGSLITSQFLHGGLLHLLGNMWYLWIFGDNVEDRLGKVRFLALYLGCGVAAGLVHVAANLNSPLPSIGASGAVAGVLGAYLVSYPFARITTLVPLLIIWPLIRLPAVLVLGSWFVIQFLNGAASIAVSSQTSGGVAWWAHIGGFLTGMACVGLVAPRRSQQR